MRTPSEKRLQTKIQAWPARYRDLALIYPLARGPVIPIPMDGSPRTEASSSF